MGVRGLSKFIEDNPHLTMPYKLHDCTVIIDGNNLMHFLYSFYDIDCAFGGDYITYGSNVMSYFSSFEKCNIKPIVILDGGNDKSSHFFSTQIERWRKRLSRVRLASETGNNEEPFLPINTSEVFQNTLSKLGVPFIQCDYESDGHIASLANQFNCPVISNDGDFYIFDVKSGYIKISSLGSCNVLTSEDKKTKYLQCKIYNLNHFLSFYPAIDKNVMPLLSSLAGNDYIKYEDLKTLSCYVYPHKGRRIEQILEYLSNRGYFEVFSEILNIMCAENQDFKTLLDYSVNTYKIRVSNLLYLFDINKYALSESEMLSNTNLVTPCGMPFPEEYIHRNNQGLLPAYFVNVITLHRLFLCTQIGDLVDRSSYNCSCFVRQVIYGILLQHKTTPSNMKDHKLLCLGDVNEYDVDRGDEIFFRTKPLYALPNGKLVPQLHEIKCMNKTQQFKFLAEVMGIETSFLKTIPEKFQLLFGIICYWLRNCSPKPAKEFLIALLLCVVHFNEVCESLLTYPSYPKNIDPGLMNRYNFLGRALSQSKRAEIFSDEPARGWSNHFDVFTINSYNQLQTCLKYLTSLNKLLMSPFMSLKSEDTFEGSFLCILTNELESSQNTKVILKWLLIKETACQEVFNLLLKRVLQNISQGFIWRKTPNWSREKCDLYQKLGF